jgi:PD-(D/E)XK nuclease superfamily
MDTIQAPPTRRHWSYSALNNFTNCPRKFHAYEIAKTVREPENPAMLEGKRVHALMAEYISKRTHLPKQYERYERWADDRTQGDRIMTEHKMGMTFQLEPCEFFDRKKTVWLRTIADLLVLTGDQALSVDWKTGKEPNPVFEVLPANFQLRCTAVCIFLHFPQINFIESEYVYLNEGNYTDFTMDRSDLREFIPQMYEYAGTLNRAVRNNHFPPRPSGLCKKHCAVTSCEYHGKGP